MRAAIYNPYLDTLGGGERYTMTFAKALADQGIGVDVEWKSKEIKNKLQDRFGIDLQNINFIKDTNRGDGYDICFWVSDGSIPTMRARKNYIHFQFPFTNVNGKSLLNKMKLIRVNKIICNSYFTKKFIDNEYGVESDVIYPPVDVHVFKSGKKENIFLYIGRFSRLTQEKRQDVLIDVFKNIYDSVAGDWKLILAGGAEVGAGNYLKELNKSSVGYPIKIVESPDFKSLKELYGSAKIFISAAGFGIDENKYPQKAEHFGITVVEAMAAGVVPIVYKAGGHREIISDGENGLMWSSVEELTEIISKVLKDNRFVNKLAKKAKSDSLIYENERFEAQVLDLINK
jgi:glycosyltransferase involved in cell wall biosynthesis